MRIYAALNVSGAPPGAAEGSQMIEPELIPLVAQRFKALGEPARLTLLAALQQGERSVSELVELTGRGQPNVSQHLKEMVHAGLVEARREGARIYYRISDPYVNRICDAVCRSVRRSVPAPAARPARPRRAPGRRSRPGGATAAGEVDRG
jgi:DNA-binding transcriptional ArsR family regulator